MRQCREESKIAIFSPAVGVETYCRMYEPKSWPDKILIEIDGPSGSSGDTVGIVSEDIRTIRRRNCSSVRINAGNSRVRAYDAPFASPSSSGLSLSRVHLLPRVPPLLRDTFSKREATAASTASRKSRNRPRFIVLYAHRTGDRGYRVSRTSKHLVRQHLRSSCFSLRRATRQRQPKVTIFNRDEEPKP